MNIRFPLALAGSALITFAMAGCAHTDDGSSNAAGRTASNQGMSTGSSASSAGGGGSSMAGHSTSAHGTTGGSSMSSSAGGGGSSQASVPAGTGVTAVASQAEAMAALQLVDQHEIKLAQQAKSKKVTGPVLEYANMMVDHHTKHLAQVRGMLGKGGAPSDGAAVRNLMLMDQQTTARLGGLEGEAYARAYIAHMVTSHEQGIALVDAAMGRADDAAARALLTATRQSMQMHLDRARAIQSSMGGG